MSDVKIENCDTCGLPIIATINGVAYDLVAETKLGERS